MLPSVLVAQKMKTMNAEAITVFEILLKGQKLFPSRSSERKIMSPCFNSMGLYRTVSTCVYLPVCKTCLSLDWLINISALYTPTVVCPDVLILLTVVFHTV